MNCVCVCVCVYLEDRYALGNAHIYIPYENFKKYVQIESKNNVMNAFQCAFIFNESIK